MSEPTSKPIRTRFAPSPTGLLHLGHAYSAGKTWEFAHENQGEVILRIEDTDRSRCTPEFEAAIYEDLKWLGFSWGEPVRRQSEHFQTYEAAVGDLTDKGLTYPCFCTRKDILREVDESPSAPHGPFGPIYPGICKGLSEDERAHRIAEGRAFATRINVSLALAQVAKPLMFEECRGGPMGEIGSIVAKPERAGDFVIARKDIPTSYHVSVVIDDHLAEITDIVRGQDLFAATQIHRLLQELWGYAAPRYHHHALLTDPTGRRLAKRDKDQTLRSMREAGLTPDEVRAKMAQMRAYSTSRSDQKIS